MSAKSVDDASMMAALSAGSQERRSLLTRKVDDDVDYAAVPKSRKVKNAIKSFVTKRFSKTQAARDEHLDNISEITSAFTNPVPSPPTRSAAYIPSHAPGILRQNQAQAHKSADEAGNSEPIYIPWKRPHRHRTKLISSLPRAWPSRFRRIIS